MREKWIKCPKCKAISMFKAKMKYPGDKIILALVCQSCHNELQFVQGGRK